mmetsp:Transcript_5708/g.12421  ORF Transcript_5708/g.12421 Transcript_5708/m.12421 type:complete len:207 (-) Transcript_5708:705-1325(-)
MGFKGESGPERAEKEASMTCNCHHLPRYLPELTSGELQFVGGALQGRIPSAAPSSNCFHSHRNDIIIGRQLLDHVRRVANLDGQLSLAVADRVASDACVEWLDTIRPESRVISAAHAEVIAEHVAHSCQQPHVACRAPAITDVAVDVVVCLCVVAVEITFQPVRGVDEEVVVSFVVRAAVIVIDRFLRRVHADHEVPSDVAPCRDD